MGDRSGVTTCRLLLLLLLLTGLVAGSTSADESQGATNGTNRHCMPGEEGPDSTISVARLKFEEVETPLYVVMFILVVILAKMGECAVCSTLTP